MTTTWALLIIIISSRGDVDTERMKQGSPTLEECEKRGKAASERYYGAAWSTATYLCVED